jgi:NAD(P)-dependent dehydrogenase (short-subunit alcohol dehydrogenase family)
VIGQVAFITGAARGIGAETARRLAGRGARVALVGLEPEELAAVAAECGPSAAWFEADVTDPAGLRAAVDGTVERFGGIDVCVANAGIGAGGAARVMEPDAWERVIDVNLIGAYRTVRACLPHVTERRGYVLPVASIAALTSPPMLSAYCASKAGLEGFANALRIEMSPHGVRVGVAYFAWIDTELVRGADREHPAFRLLRSKLRGPLAVTHPLGDAGEAMARGIERRARLVYAPGWVRGMIAMRAIVQRVAEIDFVRAMPELDAAMEADIRERGVAAASAPPGAGGHADAASRRGRTADVVS